MISVNALHIEFSGVDLFSSVSFVINPKDRIGLVGKNGVGKSSLLKVLIGQLKPSGGSVVIPQEASVGYLPQEMKFESTATIKEEAMKAFFEITSLEKELKVIENDLNTREDYHTDEYISQIERLSYLHEKLALMDSSNREEKVEKVLKGIGFSTEELNKKVSSFSGGWQMRVELAKLLIQMPDLLLLDEPTNHLDIESIMWLEAFFSTYPGAIMLISHDRAFLDQVTNRTIEIVAGRIYDYKAAYSKFVVLRQERLLQQESTFKNQQKYISQQEKFIERFRAKSSKAKQVQSKIKQLDKMDRVEFDQFDSSKIKFRFPPAPRSGEMVLTAETLSKAYGEHKVLNRLDFHIKKKEKIAFVGQNGQGKSTLVKMIMGHTSFDGVLTVGHNVAIGYYAQVQEGTLDENISVLQTIEKEAKDEWAKMHKIRGLLGAFLFGDEDVDKKVKVLSGGEKSRLALAKLLLNPVNLLILDEPTNHLDMDSKEVLKSALKNFDGTLIVVSHDREFLEGLTGRTFEFIGGGIREHIGGITEFLRAKNFDTFRALELDKKQESKPAKQTPEENNLKSENTYQKQKLDKKKINQLRSDIKKMESKLEGLEAQLTTLEEKIAEGISLDPSSEVYFKHAEIQKEMDVHWKNWEKMQDELKALEA